MKSDHRWLEQWQGIFKGKRVLELGCGDGRDSRILAEHVASLVACDLKVDSALAAKSVDSHVQYLAVDHSKPLPFKDNEFDVVIASLSLHYFSWINTREIINELSRVIVSGGQLICRVNSHLDVNYGAQGHPELEPGWYDVKGVSKRFFQKTDIQQLFDQSWHMNNIVHKSIDRYPETKNIWEFMASHQQKVQLRKASHVDAVEISRLIEPLVIKYILPTCTQEGGGLLMASMTAHSIDKYFTLGYEYTVAEVAGKIVAVIGIKENSHLYHLFVDDDYQGKGIAKSLWGYAKEQCLCRGNNGVFTVNAALTAVDLYHHWGFVSLSDVRNRSGVKDVPMQLTL
ncbi:MAG: GNAT family N-acetyltransferase [Oceanospirillaceae bacterium]|nr:GNAT family N-acetyltransferase [Oceanospirillaceae bacterium]